MSAQSGEDTAQFVYDGLGRCLKRTVSWETTLIVYDGWKPIVEWNVWEGEAYFKAWNVYGPGADEILWRYADSSGHLRYHSDRHGNIVALLDGAGNGIEKYSYDVFGRATVTDWSGGDVRYGSWYGNRFLFQGREYFPELGLYDYRNRFYHPILGRFLQTDPTGFDAGDMNLFRYCGDDPVDGSDPTGLVDTSATKEYSTLTSFGGGDWIKGSDGLSALDWNDRNSIRPQAGMDGGGGGGGTDRSGVKAVSPENEGAKSSFVKTTDKYTGGYPAIKEAQRFLKHHYPELKPYKYKISDTRLLRLLRKDGLALPGLPIFLDTSQMTSYREVVRTLSHELLHKRDGWRKSTNERHAEIIQEAEKIGQEYFYGKPPEK